ncbi:MAG: outer membrane protein assembly factor BamB family protein [Actinomycetota bacterium]
MARGETLSGRAERRRAEKRRRRGRVLAIAASGVVVAGAAGVGIVLLGGDDDGGGSTRRASSTDPTTTTAAATTTTAPPFVGFVDPATVGQPYGTTVPGVLTFRGNPTRTYYGQGPVPAAPQSIWQYPGASMCSLSEDRGETTNWCGTGWTGQPAVFERDGRTWVIFGAYDRAVHFVDAATGQDIIPPFPTGDIIKGSVTVDPDGFPIVYTGSRDGFYRAIAFDRPQPTELWKMNAEDVQPTMWNDDWDGSAIVLNDFLFEGGENSQFHIVKLNRATGPDGLVTVAPQLVFNAPGWDDELIAAAGSEVSIEGSVSIFGDIVYFANSGGLVQGWDISGLRTGAGPPTRVFRFWTGDDTDASVVVDEAGMLYVGSEWERKNGRGTEVGQIMKLNPAAPDNPLVWSQKDDGADKAGVFGTPGIYNDLVIYTTYTGRAIGIDRNTGAIRFEKKLPAPLMGSPVIVDGVWLQGDCGGVLHAYDVRNTLVDPPELWSVTLGGCIESTPTVWKGRIYVGTRAGSFFAIGDG